MESFERGVEGCVLLFLKVEFFGVLFILLLKEKIFFVECFVCFFLFEQGTALTLDFGVPGLCLFGG